MRQTYSACLLLLCLAPSCAMSPNEIHHIPGNTRVKLNAEGCGSSENVAFRVASNLIRENISLNARRLTAPSDFPKSTSLKLVIPPSLLHDNIRLESSFMDTEKSETCVMVSFNLRNARHVLARKMSVLSQEIFDDAHEAATDPIASRRLPAIFDYLRDVAKFNKEASLYIALLGTKTFDRMNISGIRQFMQIHLYGYDTPLDKAAGDGFANLLTENGFVFTDNTQATFHLLVRVTGTWKKKGKDLFLYATVSGSLMAGNDVIASLVTPFRERGLTKTAVYSSLSNDLGKIQFFRGFSR